MRCAIEDDDGCYEESLSEVSSGHRPACNPRAIERDCSLIHFRLGQSWSRAGKLKRVSEPSGLRGRSNSRHPGSPHILAKVLENLIASFDSS